MKKQFFFSMLAGAALMASCSSDNDIATANGIEDGADGYVAFNITMPQISGTRANDDFSDGDPVPAEYKVFNAHLVLFSGTDEAAARFCGAYKMNISDFATDGSSTDQCTSEGKVTQKISKPTLGSSDHLYAYVILNHNGIITNPSATSVKIETTDGTSSVTETVDNTINFSTFSKYVLATYGDRDTGGLLMTNCPLNDEHGGTSAPADKLYTLATLDASKIYPTAAAAEADPAGDVFVERAAAKVTVSVSSSITGKLESDASITYDKANIKWVLNNENQAYYNTRQMVGSWLGLAANQTTYKEGTVPATTLYRFVSNAPIHTGAYRTYWGEDVNYDEDEWAAAMNFKFKANPAAIDKTMGTSVYTFENTFNVEHQNSYNTTQVAFAVAFNGGKTFYTANTYGANKILQIPTAGSGEKVQEYIMKYLNNNNTEFKAWYDNNGSNRITVTMADGTNGHSTVATVVAESGAEAFDILGGTFTASSLVTEINAAITFNYYKNGMAYYHSRIKHFGAVDAETPWNVANHTANTIVGVYKTYGTTSLTDAQANANYLGRYGVLRNNWYQVEVSGIKQIGTPLPGNPNKDNPTDPEDPWTPDTPDDEVENYISVKVHVTPWALRKQSVTL